MRMRTVLTCQSCDHKWARYCPAPLLPGRVLVQQIKIPLPLRWTTSYRQLQRTVHNSCRRERQVANVMSGRPSSNRGKRSHKRGGGGFDSGRPGYSNRFSNEPPPRFKRNGEPRGGGSSDGRGNYDHYEDHGRGSGSYSPHKNKQQGSSSAPRSNFDDLMQLVGKLEQQSGNSDGVCRVARQILDFFEIHVGDYRMSQVITINRNTDVIFKAFQQAIHENSEKEFVEIMENCIGHIGHALGRDSQRLFEWLFFNVNSEEVSDDERAVYLNGLHEILATDGGKSPHTAVMPYIVDNLQTVLEVAEAPALLEAVVKNITSIAKFCPQHFGHHFNNIVDILVGWHIDIQQDPILIEYIASALISLHEFWIKDMMFSVDLLKQFLEDMEAYSNELSAPADDASLPDEERSSPTQSLSRLTALIRVFTTVVTALGSSFSPSRCPEITPGFVKDIVSRVINYILISNETTFSEDLVLAGNRCLTELSKCLQGHFASCSSSVATYVIRQIDEQELPSNDHAHSIVKLLSQMVEDQQASLPSQFIQQIFSPESPVLLLRYTASEKLLSQLVKLYLSFLAIRNIPILEAMYRSIIADLEASFQQLDRCIEQPLRQEDTSSFSPIDAQVAIIFDLNVLSQLSNTSKAVIGVWSPSPTVFSLLTNQIKSLGTALASEYPAIHYALLYALLQDCRSNRYYIPGSDSPTSVSVGGTSISHASSSTPSATITDVLSLLAKQMQTHTLPFDTCRLIQRWVENIVEAVRAANKTALSAEKIRPHMDNLTLQLLALTFSREHSIRLENASVLKAIFQSGLVSGSVINKCVPECLMRLSDTRGEIRAAYSALLEVIPTHIITGFSSGADSFQPPNGRKWVEGLRNCKGTWYARRMHMTKQSQVTFHGHHFKAVMGFIMHGYAPSKHLPDDWLERMYHSCQHRHPPIPDSLDHPEMHPMLMSYLVCNCDAVLWFWATYESAQYCLLARLRTPLGQPAETFTAIENVLRGYSQEVESRDGRHLRDTPSSFSGHMGAGLGPRHYTVHLRAVLILQFMEHLDKLMYNAYEGSCVTLPPVPKSVRSFFRKNMDTCLEWLSHVRGFIVSIAIHAGMPAVAIRHGFAALKDFKHSLYNKNTPEFWKMLVNVVHALLLTKSWEAIRGMGVWVQRVVGQTPSWIIAAEAQAKCNYETACEEYIKSLKVLQAAEEDKKGVPMQKSTQTSVMEFVVNRVLECYVSVSEWKDAEMWYSHVNSLQSQYSPSSELNSAFTLQSDLNQIRALGSFETGDLAMAHDHVESLSGGLHMSRDLEVFPLWDPAQLLSTSHLLLLKAATSQAVDDGSVSDEGSVTSEGEYGPKSAFQRWLKLSSAYAESPLRVGCLEWPLRISPSHALQLQSAAAIKALNPIKSRHAQPVSSGLLLYSLPFKSLDPSHHDTSIWSESLRISSHLATSTMSSDFEDHTPFILLESYRLSRQQGNLNHANYLITRQIFELTGEMSNSVDALNAATNIQSIEKLRVMREMAKLYTCKGQSAAAVDLLSASVVNYCQSQQGAKTSGPLKSGSELAARSLLTMVKWMQGDSRLMQAIWSTDYETSQRLNRLLGNELECRKARMGLYAGSASTESYELFKPDDSVARFDKHEYAVGQLLHMATIHCPDLAKGWWSLAGWCYRIGRKNLEALSATGTAVLLEHEQEQVKEIVGSLATPEQKAAIFGVLGQVHISDTAEEDLKAKEDIKHLDVEEDSKSLKGQLLAVCPALEKLPSMDDLLGVWAGVRVRMFMHYQLSARGYFTFLKLSGSQAGSSPALDDMNVTASLRLLRLLVKYAVELKSELEKGFATTPTKPWKGIIPQLFSRLNHPENDVRQSVSDLLCRVGQDSPHFIIYPAIVGASRRSEKKTDTDSVTDYLSKSERRESENSYDIGSRDIGSRDLIGDNFTPPDSGMNDDEDDRGESSNAELTNLEKCLSVIIESLKQQNPQLVKAVEDLVAELCRITLLWDEMWLAALMQRQGEVHRRLMQIDQENKHTMSLPHLSGPEKDAIMREKYLASMKPLLWVFEHLAAITSQPAETPNERNFQAQYGETINSALQRLRSPMNYATPHSVWEPFKEFQQMLMHRAQKRMQNSLSLHEISPHLAAISSSCITMPGHNQGDEPVTLESFQLEVAVLPTKTKPKKISMIGSDGRKHTYLFKGLEDLHLDERIMQFMDIINNMFARAYKHQTQLYIAKDYAVIPLGARSGLIQWVDNITPLFGIYKRWQQREAYAKALEQAGSQPNVPVPPLQVLKPNELFYSKILPLLKEKGMSEQTPRKDWPHQIQLRVLRELMNETPSDLLAKELWCASSCASEWWAVTQTYSRSTAVMCMIGYIIGLGDRHLDNLLVEFATGQVVHVDYNVCFEKGKSLRVPERVPFRMTQNIATALGFTGVDGLFRISCEDILRILRRGRETLLTLLEAFVYDPLIDWTQSEDAAFPLAVRASKEITAGRPSRKEMERAVASGMLVTRLAESGPYWQRNRESLCSVLLALELHLDEITKTGEKLTTYHEVMLKLDRQSEILKDAVNTPNHPLITMQDKLSEQSRLVAEQKRLVSELRGKCEDAQQWNFKYKEVFRAIHETGLGAIISQMQNPLDLGPPSHEAAVDFLHSIRQSQAVEVCDMLEDDLIAILRGRRVVLNNALEALHQYRNITSQFHADYLKQSRSYLWEQCLEPILNTDLTHDNLRHIVEEFEMRLTAGSKSHNMVRAVDNKFRKAIQEQQVRLSKLAERSKSVSTMDYSKYEGVVIDAGKQLQQFCRDNPESGPPSLACFIIVALCPLSRRWLFMEQTAQAARDRLSDLTSRDGDWFLDELCTMSGNVSQMVNLLELCLTSMDHDLQPRAVLHSTIGAVNAVHKVYVGMQDLFNKFQSLVLPEAVNFLLSEDEGVLEMINEVANFTLTSYPGENIRSALKILADGLRERSIKSVPADLSMTAAVEEMRNKLSSLLVTQDRNSDTPMSSAQVILNSLHGLFQMSESATHHMLTVMTDIIIPETWEGIDLIKQTQGLMCTSSGLSLTDELLFVHKAQAIVDFCIECRNLWKAFKLDFSPTDGPDKGVHTPTPPGTPGHKHPSLHVPTDSHLGLPIRRYIAETLICHVLGQPSYALACLIVSATTQNLQIKLPNKQLSIEDVCKLANDHCQTALPMPVIQHARTLFSQHDVAWREGDKVRRLMTNIENTKQSLQRMRGVTARFQWLHEEKLVLPDSHYPWVGTQRAVVLTTIKKVLAAEQMGSQLTSILDKINSQQFRISQRLQWAAGANPALNSIVDEFERCMKRRKQILQEEEDMYLKVYEYCDAVIHLESSHTRVPQKTSDDKDTIEIIQRCADATVKLQLCAEQLSQVSDILPYIEFPEDGGPLTLDWMHTRLEELTINKTKILNDKRTDNTKLAKHKESVLSELEKLRGLNRAHRKLMLEIWPHLTALARLEEPPPPGQVQPGPRAFINLQNKFGDEVRSFIQSTQELIASDMSLAAKPTWTSRARVEEFAQMRNAAENLRVLAECLLGQLLSFTDQLFQGQPCGSLRWNPPPMIESMIPKSVSMVSVASQAHGSTDVGGAGGGGGDPSQQQQQQQQQQTKIYRSSQGIVRDKRTGKALQEQNSYAVGVWRRVKAKLDGRDPDANYRLTVSEQVKFVIDDATSQDNLCQLYEGWTPWV